MTNQPDSLPETPETSTLREHFVAKHGNYHQEFETDLADLIDQEKVRARFVELDLLEQALNDGRDLQAYKLQRLEALEKESK